MMSSWFSPDEAHMVSSGLYCTLVFWFFQQQLDKSILLILLDRLNELLHNW